MNSKNVLIPLDLVRSPCDALIYARDMAVETPISVTLLYVLNLNIGLAGPAVRQELLEESEAALRRLAGFFFGTDQAVRIVVREGSPHEQILAEAKKEEVDLILLTSPKDRGWKRFMRRSTVEKIIDSAPCPTLLLPRRRAAMLPEPIIPLTRDTAPTRAAA
jgi:nucleotide-binding universal stress UspA family protein